MSNEFNWNDQLVNEFVNTVLRNGTSNQTIEQFKASKQVKEWEVVKYEFEPFLFKNSGTGQTINPIHSVKRLSDGVIFTVGEVVEGYKNTGIKEFRMFDWGLRAITDANGDGCICKELSWEIKSLKKATRTPLFTTHDGKEVFEGQEYWHICKDWTAQSEIAREAGRKEYAERTMITFSTRSAAEEYCAKNKPVFSVIYLLDKMKCVDQSEFEMKLTKLAKELL